MFQEDSSIFKFATIQFNGAQKEVCLHDTFKSFKREINHSFGMNCHLLVYLDGELVRDENHYHQIYQKNKSTYIGNIEVKESNQYQQIEEYIQFKLNGAMTEIMNTINVTINTCMETLFRNIQGFKMSQGNMNQSYNQNFDNQRYQQYSQRKYQENQVNQQSRRNQSQQNFPNEKFHNYGDHFPQQNYKRENNNRDYDDQIPQQNYKRENRNQNYDDQIPQQNYMRENSSQNYDDQIPHEDFEEPINKSQVKNSKFSAKFDFNRSPIGCFNKESFKEITITNNGKTNWPEKCIFVGDSSNIINITNTPCNSLSPGEKKKVKLKMVPKKKAKKGQVYDIKVKLISKTFSMDMIGEPFSFKVEFCSENLELKIDEVIKRLPNENLSRPNARKALQENDGDIEKVINSNARKALQENDGDIEKTINSNARKALQENAGDIEKIINSIEEKTISFLFTN